MSSFCIKSRRWTNEQKEKFLSFMLALVMVISLYPNANVEAASKKKTVLSSKTVNMFRYCGSLTISPTGSLYLSPQALWGVLWANDEKGYSDDIYGYGGYLVTEPERMYRIKEDE